MVFLLFEEEISPSRLRSETRDGRLGGGGGGDVGFLIAKLN